VEDSARLTQLSQVTIIRSATSLLGPEVRRRCYAAVALDGLGARWPFGPRVAVKWKRKCNERL